MEKSPCYFDRSGRSESFYDDTSDKSVSSFSFLSPDVFRRGIRCTLYLAGQKFCPFNLLLGTEMSPERRHTNREQSRSFCGLRVDQLPLDETTRTPCTDSEPTSRGINVSLRDPGTSSPEDECPELDPTLLTTSSVGWCERSRILGTSVALES